MTTQHWIAAQKAGMTAATLGDLTMTRQQRKTIFKESPPTLYIVATPIGTLSDFSPRARTLLESVDFIACEDTRRTRELLSALNLQHGPLISLHEHNERDKSESLVERIIASPRQNAALVSDAGTPAVSDPGALFVHACHTQGVRVESVPGPSSLASAIAASGFLRPRTIFSGFLSRQSSEQCEEFQRWLQVSPCLAVCFESPHRILATLETAASVFSSSVTVCLSREISKKFEEHIRGSIDEVIKKISQGQTIRGECVLTFDIPGGLRPASAPTHLSANDLVIKVIEIVQADPSAHIKELTKKLAQEHGANTKELYNLVVRALKR